MTNKKLLINFSLFIFLFSLNESIYAQKLKEDDNFKKAVKYFYQKKMEMAEILLQEEIKKNPENSLAYSYLGDIFFGKKRYDDAMTFYRKSLEIDPKGAENYFRIGQIFYYKKDSDKAIDSFNLSYKLDKKIKFAYYHIGLSYLILKRDKNNTIEYWENFLKIAPEDPQFANIQRAIALLRDPNFVLPPPGSDISIEEALQLGGSHLEAVDRKADEQEAGHEAKKTKSKLEGIYKDDDL
jgi:tetratricopeptide (TPR) repeat protein